MWGRQERPDPAIGTQLRRGTGLRRTDWIRITIGGDEPVAEAVGVRHRLPASVQIPLTLAVALSSAGFPLVVRRTPPGRAATDR